MVLETTALPIELLAYSIILETTPEPTVLPPSLIAKFIPSSIATGEINSTVNLYRWEWNEVAEKMGVDNQPSVGVLAQELIEYRPDLVMMYEDGYFRVNYSGLLS